MADTQEQPQLSGENMPGSIREAQEALLGIMEPEEVKPKEEEAAPTEEEESTEEIQDESLEEEDQELEASEYDEEGSEDQTDDEEVEEPESDEPDLYSVTVDGEEHEVTFDELLKGYSRQSDYTKKTQSLATERKEIEELKQSFESQSAQMQQERQQYIQNLESIMRNSVGNLSEYENIDWNALKDSDPIEYVKLREDYRDGKERVEELQRQQQVAIQQQQAESQRVRDDALKIEQQKLIEAVPEWSNPDTRKDIVSEIKSYAKSQGFTDEELESLIDHRSVVVLMKAAKLDKMEKSNIKSKKLKNKPKSHIRSGKGTSQNKQSKSKRTAQMKRLQQSGHVRDATSLFEDFVDL